MLCKRAIGSHINEILFDQKSIFSNDKETSYSPVWMIAQKPNIKYNQPLADITQ